jgi:hypothetical protein
MDTVSLGKSRGLYDSVHNIHNYGEYDRLWAPRKDVQKERQVEHHLALIVDITFTAFCKHVADSSRLHKRSCKLWDKHTLNSSYSSHDHCPRPRGGDDLHHIGWRSIQVSQVVARKPTKVKMKKPPRWTKCTTEKYPKQ